jgi:hypothetical protein
VWEVKTIEILIVSIFKSNSSVKNVLESITEELGVVVTLYDYIREVLVRILSELQAIVCFGIRIKNYEMGFRCCTVFLLISFFLSQVYSFSRISSREFPCEQRSRVGCGIRSN